MKNLEQFAQDRIDVQCLVCDWKGKWEETTLGVKEGPCVCPRCQQGYLVTAEERKADDFWEIRPGLKEKISKLKMTYAKN